MKCSKCGRNVVSAVVVCDECRVEPNNKPLALDELRETSADMENRQWIWIETLMPFDCKEKESAYYRVISDFTQGRDFCCGYPGLIFAFDYEDYNKTWLAYRCKPAANGEKGVDIKF